MVDNGANVNQKTVDEYSSLLIAVCRPNLEIIKILFRNGANTKAVNKLGQTAIHLAAIYGSPEAMTYLISNGRNTYYLL